MHDTDPDGATTDDFFLDGALRILQPKSGYRAGLDAVLLAAAVRPRYAREHRVLDCGAGVGVVGLCIAKRIAEAEVTLAEQQRSLAELAARNVQRNGLADRVRVSMVDVAKGGAILHDAEAATGLQAASFEDVVANPPYWTTGHGTASTAPLRAAAHAMPAGDLDSWVRFMITAAASDGTLTLVYPAAGLTLLLQAMQPRVGNVAILPVHPRQSEPATRVIVSGTKGSRAPLRLLAGLVLHDADNAFRPEVETILRHGAPLTL